MQHYERGIQPYRQRRGQPSGHQVHEEANGLVPRHQPQEPSGDEDGDDRDDRVDGGHSLNHGGSAIERVHRCSVRLTRPTAPNVVAIADFAFKCLSDCARFLTMASPGGPHTCGSHRPSRRQRRVVGLRIQAEPYCSARDLHRNASNHHAPVFGPGCRTGLHLVRRRPSHAIYARPRPWNRCARVNGLPAIGISKIGLASVSGSCSTNGRICPSVMPAYWFSPKSDRCQAWVIG